jgi:transcription termination factor Rho
MPTSSSDSEGTSERPRRRTSTRSPSSAPARRPSTRSKKIGTEDSVAPVPSVSDDDFGSGVVNEERPARQPRERKSSTAAEPKPSAESPSDEVRVPKARSERSPARRGTRSTRPVPSDAPPESTSNESERSERTSSRFERQIADVEPQTGMRYFSSEELDFGDDDGPAPARDAAPLRDSGPTRDGASDRGGRSPRHSGRGRSRYRGDSDLDRSPLAERRPESDRQTDRDFASDRELDDDRDQMSDDYEGGGPGDGEDGAPLRQGELFDGDRRPRRRRRRRRRGGDGVGDGDTGPRGPETGRNDLREPGRNDVREPGRGDGREPGRNDVREPGRSDVREPRRNDGREPSRFQSGGRPEGNRGRNDGPRGGDGRNDGNRGRRGGRNDGGRNDGGRGRRSEGGPPRGGRDMGRGRDLGGPRRGRTIQPSGEVVEGTFDGVLELHPRGYGFLRDPKRNYAAEDSNPFVSSSLVEKYKLRQGVLIRGDVGQGTRNQGPRLREVELIDGFTPEEYLNVKNFDNLTAINPFEQIKLEIGPKPLTMRVMDLLCPIGKGQRALLVAPPRTGKTMLLQDMANSVSINHPEIHLMVLLIDERPEEVTEMRRMVKGEVISSSLDSDVESHIRIAELIIERAKRLAEEGKDVFILLDSITRLARAFNKANNSGRTGTGGLDIRAMDIPKKLFGQARRFDEGGSLTVCGTALIDTGGRIDEAIFQEFKGTGNMEMVLSRELADRRIWPSIDITKSGTRREEKILAPDLLEGITMLRRSLISLSPVEAMEQLTKTMERFPTNREFLTKIKAVL